MGVDAVQWQMVKVIGLAVMLSACTTSNTLKPVLGNESYTPQGWVQYCKDNPQDTDCLTLQ